MKTDWKYYIKNYNFQIRQKISRQLPAILYCFALFAAFVLLVHAQTYR